MPADASGRVNRGRRPENAPSSAAWTTPARELEDGEGVLRLLEEHASDLVYLLDLEGRTVYASPSVGRLVGLDPESLRGTDLFRRIHPEDLSAARLAWEETLRTGERVASVVRTRHADGSWRWIEGSGVLVEHRGAPHVLGVCRDITERMRTEQALREREADLELALAGGRLGDWKWNIETGEVTWSTACKAIYGLPADTEMSYERFLACVHPEDRERVDAALQQAVESRSDYEVEKRIVWPDGSLHWNQSRGRVFCDASGTAVRMAGVTMDITARRLADEALRERTEELNSVLASVSDYLWSGEYVGGRWRYRFYSPVVERITGHPPEFFLAGPERWLSTIHPDDRPAMQQAFSRLIEGESPREEAEYRVLRPDGSLRWVRDSASAVPLPQGGLRLDGVVSDVTARKEAERKLRALVENIPDFVSRFDAQGRFLYVNPAVTKAFGAPPEAILGKTLLDASLPARGPSDALLHEAVWRCLREGRPNVCEATWPTLAGDRFFEVRHLPETDESGQVVSVLGLARDVTERRRAEQGLRASLEEKEVLLREVHHRVKNNLQLISSLLALQADRVRDPAVAGALTESQNRIRAMALVHENLYRSADLATIHLTEHVESICAHLYRSYGVDAQRIALELHIADVPVDLDRSMRCGLIINELVSNALKHGFPGDRSGRISVDLGADHGGRAELRVRDDGIGCPPELDPRRCDTLGLQLVADLVEHLAGTLVRDPEPGTSWRISFPLVPPEPSR